MSTAAPDPRAIAQALLQLTAKSWGVEVMDVGLGQPVMPIAVIAGVARSRQVLRRAAHRVAPTARRATAADITPDQWPYWPSYPGLAADWR